jgi:diguanylate cyclase (GGDEF)-like protein
MGKISEVVKQTILNLKQNNIDPTPNEYHKEFCKVAKDIQIDIKECKQFKEFVSRLSQDEQKKLEEKNIETFDELITILLERVATKNIKSLTSILKSGMVPSISLSIDDKLAQFSIKIGDSPSLIFEEDIQKEMQKFINQRFEADKQIVKKKTEDIAKLITLMSKYLGDAIESHSKSGNNVSDIKSSIESIDIGNADQKDLSDLQSQLIDAALSIENEMNTVNQHLQSGQDQVNKLEEKIKKLESELHMAKKESSTDHLTGVLTRRAYDKEVTKIEKEYARTQKSFAVVFFDIDHFKNINDTYGHDAGDVVLATFGKILQKETREQDIVARYGGEEFVAIIHYNLERELLHYLKRVKKIVGSNKFVYKEHKIKLTFSAGVASRDSYNDYKSAVEYADSLVYKAKKSGRDKIILDTGKEI